MKKSIGLASGLVLGAGVMFFLDPLRGRRRRAITRDRARSVVREAGHSLGAASRDLSHRVQGAAAETRHYFSIKPVDDEVLQARVRARLGHLVSRPHAVEVIVHEGEVILRGSTEPGELAELLRGVQSVWGVRRVRNECVQRTG